MKNFIVKTFFIFSLCFILPASCANGIGDDAAISYYSSSIPVTVSTQNTSVRFDDTSSRLITPNVLNYDTASNLKFYVWRKTTDKVAAYIEGSLQEISITKVNSTTGTFTLDCARTYVRLEMAAVIPPDPAKEPNWRFNPTDKSSFYLYGSVLVDLRYCTNIDIYLNYNSFEGFGTVSLAPYYTWNLPADYEINAGLYKLTDDQNAYGSSASVFSATHYTSTPSDPYYYKMENNVPPGQYNFKVQFAHKTNSKLKFTYSERLVVYANMETKAVIEIPNIIESIPAAPSGLIAGYVDSPNEYYYVEFCWQDNSNNEEGFQIELLDITSVHGNLDVSSDQVAYSQYLEEVVNYPSHSSLDASTIDAAWKAASILVGGSEQTKLAAYNSSYKSDISDCGALCANSTYTVFKILYGKRYLARIKAVGYGGDSGYAYLDLFNESGRTFDDIYADPNTDSSKYGGTFTPTAWTYDAAGTNSATGLGRFKVEYNVCGGKFLDDSSSNDVTSQLSLYAYGNETKSGSFPIMTALNYEYSLGNTASLKYNNGNSLYAWKWWKLDDAINGENFTYTPDASTPDLPRTSYMGCDNLNLFAYYGNVAAVSESIAENVLISGNTSAALSIDASNKIGDGSSPVYSVSKASFPYVMIALNTSSSSAQNYNLTTLTFSIGENGAGTKPFASSAIKTASFDFTKNYSYVVLDLNGTLPDGSAVTSGENYIINYSLENNSGAALSYTFVLKVED